MHESAQWWLVITNPSADTKLAEHPCASRAEDSRRCSSHLSSTDTLYFCFSLSLGKLLYVHIPSSARTRAGAQPRLEVANTARPTNGSDTAGLVICTSASAA